MKQYYCVSASFFGDNAIDKSFGFPIKCGDAEIAPEGNGEMLEKAHKYNNMSRAVELAIAGILLGSCFIHGAAMSASADVDANNKRVSRPAPHAKLKNGARKRSRQ